MADISSTLRAWSATAGSNNPAGTTTVGTNVDDNFREIQAVIKAYLAGAPANMTSASTVDLATATSNYVNVTGTTTITALGTEVSGISYLLKFAGILTLTYNGTSLILPGGNNITTAAGDMAYVVSEGSGNWRCVWYTPADGLLTRQPEVLIIPVTDETTAITTGTSKYAFRMPFAMTLTAIRGSLNVAQTSGNIVTVDVNESTSSILSTKLTIDNTEKTSTSPATPAVLSDTSLADDAEITVDIDQVGDGTAKGLKVYLIGYRT